MGKPTNNRVKKHDSNGSDAGVVVGIPLTADQMNRWGHCLFGKIQQAEAKGSSSLQPKTQQ